MDADAESRLGQLQKNNEMKGPAFKMTHDPRVTPLGKFLRKFAPPNKINVVVTSNHSTPCKYKDHSSDPVPVLMYNDCIHREKEFNENEAKKGSLRARQY